MTILQTVNLEQHAGSKILLRNINLTIEQGEFFVIIGPTGAGKTTLLRLLNLLDNPSAGTIIFRGQDVARSAGNSLAVRRRMAMVFQKPVVFNSSVFENVAYPLQVRGQDRRSSLSRVNDVLAITGLGGYGKRRAKTLSGGETQRVALARALIAGPELLLLDEPTANLDPASARMIEETVLKFNRERGVTIIMATHDMAQGQRLAQRAGVLMQGELIQAGSPLEIFQRPEDVRVANFVGIKNILSGLIVSNESGIAGVQVSGRTIYCVSDLAEGSPVDIYIRPDDIVLSSVTPASSARNTLKAIIRNLDYSGALCTAQVDCGFPIEALVTARSADEMNLREGQDINISFKATAVRVLRRAEG